MAIDQEIPPDEDFGKETFLIKYRVRSWGVYTSENIPIRHGTFKECVDYCRRLGFSVEFEIPTLAAKRKI